MQPQYAYRPDNCDSGSISPAIVAALIGGACTIIAAVIAAVCAPSFASADKLAPQPGLATPVVERCKGVDEDWRNTAKLGSREAYEEHLARFPHCSFSMLARTRMDRLDEEAIRLADARFMATLRNIKPAAPVIVRVPQVYSEPDFVPYSTPNGYDPNEPKLWLLNSKERDPAAP